MARDTGPREWVRRAKAAPFLVECTLRSAAVGCGMVSDAPASSKRSGKSVGLTSAAQGAIEICGPNA